MSEGGRNALNSLAAVSDPPICRSYRVSAAKRLIEIFDQILSVLEANG